MRNGFLVNFIVLIIGVAVKRLGPVWLSAKYITYARYERAGKKTELSWIQRTFAYGIQSKKDI